MARPRKTAATAEAGTPKRRTRGPNRKPRTPKAETGAAETLGLIAKLPQTSQSGEKDDTNVLSPELRDARAKTALGAAESQAALDILAVMNAYLAFGDTAGLDRRVWVPYVMERFGGYKRPFIKHTLAMDPANVAKKGALFFTAATGTLSDEANQPIVLTAADTASVADTLPTTTPVGLTPQPQLTSS